MIFHAGGHQIAYWAILELTSENASERMEYACEQL